MYTTKTTQLNSFVTLFHIMSTICNGELASMKTSMYQLLTHLCKESNDLSWHLKLIQFGSELNNNIKV